MSSQTGVGSISAISRFPVKSMMGEQLDAVDITLGGLVGDRAYALLDQADGKVVSAKNPLKWPGLFDYRAAFVEPPRADQARPPVRITLPDGTVTTSDQADASEILSRVLGRPVNLTAKAPAPPTLEEYWPEIDDSAYRDTVTDEALLVGTFFDCATVHLLTTATLDCLREAYPSGRFEANRFRPNIVVATPPGVTGFVEDAWVGRRLTLGGLVRLRITGPCPRCIMATLAQGDLPRDIGILRTVLQENQRCVGVYAVVERGGTIRCGDPVRLEG